MSCGVDIFASCYKDDKELNRFGKKNQEIDNPRLRFVVVALEPCMMTNKPMRRSLAHCCRGPCLCSSRREKTKMMRSVALLVVLAFSSIGLEIRTRKMMRLWLWKIWKKRSTMMMSSACQCLGGSLCSSGREKNDEEPNSLLSWPSLLQLWKKESKSAMKKIGFEPSLPCSSKLLAIAFHSKLLVPIALHSKLLPLFLL
jgi:hypothetical protein